MDIPESTKGERETTASRIEPAKPRSRKNRRSGIKDNAAAAEPDNVAPKEIQSLEKILDAMRVDSANILSTLDHQGVAFGRLPLSDFRNDVGSVLRRAALAGDSKLDITSNSFFADYCDDFKKQVKRITDDGNPIFKSWLSSVKSRTLDGAQELGERSHELPDSIFNEAIPRYSKRFVVENETICDQVKTKIEGYGTKSIEALQKMLVPPAGGDQRESISSNTWDRYSVKERNEIRSVMQPVVEQVGAKIKGIAEFYAEKITQGMSVGEREFSVVTEGTFESLNKDGQPEIRRAAWRVDFVERNVEPLYKDHVDLLLDGLKENSQANVETCKYGTMEEISHRSIKYQDSIIKTLSKISGEISEIEKSLGLSYSEQIKLKHVRQDFYLDQLATCRLAYQSRILAAVLSPMEGMEADMRNALNDNPDPKVQANIKQIWNIMLRRFRLPKSYLSR